MGCVIRGLEFAAAYLDDLIVFSESWEDHLIHIRSVLERLRKAGLTAKAKKCEFGASECVYLGHIVGSGSVKPETDKTAAIHGFPTPQTKTDVSSFLGITGYYRRFVILQHPSRILQRRMHQTRCHGHHLVSRLSTP